MTNTPTSRQAANIAAFAAKWHEGDLGSGPKVKATAQRYLDLFRDWIWISEFDTAISNIEKIKQTNAIPTTSYQTACTELAKQGQ